MFSCLAGIWELGWSALYYIDLELPLNVQGGSLWFVLNTCVPLRSVEFWYRLDRESLCDQCPVKTLVLMRSLGQKHHTGCLSSRVGEEGALCEPWPGGRVREEVHVRVPPDSALDFSPGGSSSISLPPCPEKS